MKRMIMKRRNLLSIALVLLLLAVTALTFAYWDELTGNKDGTINIGEGKRIEITETLEAPERKKLIPTGKIKGVNDVYKIEVKYNVSVTEVLTGFKLNVEVTEKHDLLNADVIIGEFSEEGVAEVTITFTLNEPKDKTAYDAIINQKLNYTVNFEYKE